jgi:hypothetical protein
LLPGAVGVVVLGVTVLGAIAAFGAPGAVAGAVAGAAA